jgi:hypothetical protein
VYLYVSDACRQDKCRLCEKNENMPVQTPGQDFICGGGQCAHTCHGFSEVLSNEIVDTRRTYVGTCEVCNHHLDKVYPRHDASRSCRVGKKPHCDCGVCVRTEA